MKETAAQAAQRQQMERACAQLLGLIGGITADGHLHDMEIQFLRTWLAGERVASDHWLGRAVSQHLDAVLADGHVTEEERAWLLEKLQSASGAQFAETGCASAETTAAFPADDGPVHFDGKTFCLTGKFLFGSRGQCTAATKAAGAACTDRVTQDTDYLVIGAAGATASWKQASYGAKIDAAMKLKEKGHRILILAEPTWRAALPALPDAQA